MGESDRMTAAESPRDPQRRRSRLVAGLAAAAAVVVVILVVVLVTGGDDDSEPETGTPTEVSAQELREFAKERGNPVFWAGEIEGTKLEFTETSRGHVFVRYLPDLAPIGDDKPLYTTVATYPQPDALGTVRRSARRRGSVRRAVPGRGLATWRRSRPNSVYMALPDVDFLVEVFSPQAKTAQSLATSGRVKPAL